MLIADEPERPRQPDRGVRHQRMHHGQLRAVRGHRERNAVARTTLEAPAVPQLQEQRQLQSHLPHRGGGECGRRRVMGRGGRGVHLLRQWRLHLRLQCDWPPRCSTCAEMIGTILCRCVPSSTKRTASTARSLPIMLDVVLGYIDVCRLHRCCSAISLIFDYVEDNR